MRADETIEAFKRDVLISPLRIFVSDLYERMFEDGYVPPEALDEVRGGGLVFFPESKEDFDAMFEDWQDADLSGIQNVFSEDVSED